MISVNIQDTKNFMSHLLAKDTFDRFYLSEAFLATANSYTIDGRINRAFYSPDETEALEGQKYSLWQAIRPTCYSLIRGSRVPSALKFIFVMPDADVARLLESNDLPFSADDIDGLFVNIRYSDGCVNLTTGTSMRLFTLDKSLEHCFDREISSFLTQAGIDFEEI